jgi:hypothetical protein
LLLLKGIHGLGHPLRVFGKIVNRIEMRDSKILALDLVA